jgi:hypothetical protein
MADELTIKSGGRIGCIQSFYYNMSQRSYIELLSQSEEYTNALSGLNAVENQTYENDDYIAAHDRFSAIQSQIRELSIRVIVFAAMCVEAAIYDYAAWHLTDKYVQDRLDKLDVLSKWMVIPRLVTKRELSRSGQSYEKLKKLIQLRNELVHWKSSELADNVMKPDPEGNRYGEKFDQDLVEGAHDAMQAIILTSLEMEQIVSTRHLPNALPSFVKQPFAIHPPEMKPLIIKCRQIIGRQKQRSYSNSSVA